MCSSGRNKPARDSAFVVQFTRQLPIMESCCSTPTAPPTRPVLHHPASKQHSESRVEKMRIRAAGLPGTGDVQRSIQQHIFGRGGQRGSGAHPNDAPVTPQLRKSLPSHIGVCVASVPANDDDACNKSVMIPGCVKACTAPCTHISLTSRVCLDSLSLSYFFYRITDATPLANPTGGVNHSFSRDLGT